MKNVTLSNKSETIEEIANEVFNILCKSADTFQDFQLDGEEIIEYDLAEEDDPIHWKMYTIEWNDDSTASHVNIDC